MKKIIVIGSEKYFLNIANKIRSDYKIVSFADAANAALMIKIVNTHSYSGIILALTPSELTQRRINVHWLIKYLGEINFKGQIIALATHADAFEFFRGELLKNIYRKTFVMLNEALITDLILDALSGTENNQ